MVAKFTFQSVFGNSRRNPRRFSARGRDRTHSSRILSYKTNAISKGKTEGNFFIACQAAGKKTINIHLEKKACLYVIRMSWLNRDNRCKKHGRHENSHATVLTQDINFKTQK